MQMCVSMPHRSTVVRWPGRRFSNEQNTSLPKQENISLSMGVLSGKIDAKSGTVLPKPFAYLGCRDRRDLEDASEANQQLDVSHEAFFFPDGRQQFLLHVDDD